MQSVPAAKPLPRENHLLSSAVSNATSRRTSTCNRDHLDLQVLPGPFDKRVGCYLSHGVDLLGSGAPAREGLRRACLNVASPE